MCICSYSKHTLNGSWSVEDLRGLLRLLCCLLFTFLLHLAVLDISLLVYLFLRAFVVFHLGFLLVGVSEETFGNEKRMEERKCIKNEEILTLCKCVSVLVCVCVCMNAGFTVVTAAV